MGSILVFLALGVQAGAAPVEDVGRSANALLEHASYRECVLADTKNVLCYARSGNTDHIIQYSRDGSRLVPAVVHSQPAGLLKFTGFSAQVSASGRVTASWVEEIDHRSNRIALLVVDSAAHASKREIRKFEGHELASDLATFALGDDRYLFLFMSATDAKPSPIADAGARQRLWALLWNEHGAVAKEVGSAPKESYAVLPTGEGDFRIAWHEFHDGWFVDRDELFFAGLTLRLPDTFEVTEARKHRIPRNASGWARHIGLLALCPLHEGTAAAVLSYGLDRPAKIRIVTAAGETIGSGFPAPARLSDMSCAPDGPLLQYLETDESSGNTLIVHWRDLPGGVDQQAAIPSAKALRLRQAPRDCYLWLEVQDHDADIGKTCRP
jgi:hypothetical protein